MKRFNTLGLDERCNITGQQDGLSFKIARTSTTRVLAGEKLHYHTLGYEFYLVISGKMLLKVNNDSVEVCEGQLVVVEPNEPHKVVEIVGSADYLVINTNSDPLDKIVLE